MSEYIIGVCTTIDVDGGEEIDKYYKVYLKEPSGVLWYEYECDMLEQAQEYVKELEEKEQHEKV